jgi:hypothetical protein
MKNIRNKIFIPDYDFQGMQIEWRSSKYLKVLYTNQLNHPIFLLM